jgi:hypothetical protein
MRVTQHMQLLPNLLLRPQVQDLTVDHLQMENG